MDEQQEYVETEETVEAEPTAEVEDQQTQELPPADELEAEGIPAELPEDPTKQKEAFIKMRQQLKQLRQAPAQPEEPEDFAEQFQVPPSPTMFGADPNDPMTRAQEAERTAHQALAKLQVMEAEMKFPQMSKSSDAYNPMFKKMVDREMVYQSHLAAASGKPAPTVAQVAAQVAKELGAFTQTTAATTKQEAQEELRAKEQAVYETRSTSPNVQPPADNSQRRLRISHGDERALIDELMEGELSKYSEKDLGFF